MSGESGASRREQIARLHRGVEEALEEALRGGERLVVVQAPPGSGKTTLLVRAAAYAHRKRLQVAIGTQTNRQADDVAGRLVRDGGLEPFRFAGRGYDAERLPEDAADRITVTDSAGELQTRRAVAVGTVAKWTSVDLPATYDLLLVDEAWQMHWASFMPCGQVAERFVLIGDPGQVPPVVTVDTSRWETAPRPPHVPAPDVILRDPGLRALRLSLPATRRLPHGSAQVVRDFYDFEFDSWAAPGDRRLEAKRGGSDAVDGVVDRLRERSITLLTLPTPEHGPPLELDEEIGRAASEVTRRLLDRRSSIAMADAAEGVPRRALRPEDIGISATHRVMNTFIEQALPPALRGLVHVDTPERWQGLERAVMIAIHPLSGTIRPSSFDLETGRLCVMASRHKIALVVVSRDHVGETLEGFVPSADQAVGCDDVNGRGHDRHLRFWEALSQE